MYYSGLVCRLKMGVSTPSMETFVITRKPTTFRREPISGALPIYQCHNAVALASLLSDSRSSMIVIGMFHWAEYPASPRKLRSR